MHKKVNELFPVYDPIRVLSNTRNLYLDLISRYKKVNIISIKILKRKDIAFMGVANL